MSEVLAGNREVLLALAGPGGDTPGKSPFPQALAVSLGTGNCRAR